MWISKEPLSKSREQGALNRRQGRVDSRKRVAIDIRGLGHVGAAPSARVRPDSLFLPFAIFSHVFEDVKNVALGGAAARATLPFGRHLWGRMMFVFFAG